MKAHEILNQAQTEMQDRAKTYDKPAGERSMGACINAFEAITKVKLTVEQGWLFMCLLKAVRSQQGDYRADNYVDLAAYAGLMGEAASDPDYRDRRLNGLRAMKDEARGLPKHSQPVSPFECRSSYSDELKTIFNDAFRSTEIPGWHDITPEEDEAFQALHIGTEWCDHSAGRHSYSSTKEAQCIDCKEMLMGGDDAKLTQHKRKSGVGPDT